MRLGLLHASLVLCLLACDQPTRTTGGTSTDTDNALSLVVVDDNGIPLKGALGRLLSAGGIPDTSMRLGTDSVFTRVVGADGLLAWRDLPAGAWSLEVVGKSRGIRLSIVKSPKGSIDLGQVVARPLGGLAGTAPVVPGLGRAWVWVEGSASLVPTDSSGSFLLDKVASGPCVVRTLVPESPVQPRAVITSVEPGEVTINVRSELAGANVPKTQDSVLLWSFDGQVSSGISSLCTTINYNCGLWKPSQDTVRVGAWSGSSARILPKGYQMFRLADSGKYLDLSRLDSVALMARGPGRLRIGFSAKAVANGEGSLMARVTLEPGWQRVTFRPVDFTPDRNSISDSLGRTWETIKTDLDRMNFESRPWSGNADGDTILVDNIFLYGMARDSLRAH